MMDEASDMVQRINGKGPYHYSFAYNGSEKLVYHGTAVLSGSGVEIDASFVPFRKEAYGETGVDSVVQQIFHATANVTHEGVLKPFFYDYSEEADMYFICYEKFNAVLDENWRNSWLRDMTFVESLGNGEIDISNWVKISIRSLVDTVSSLLDSSDKFGSMDPFGKGLKCYVVTDQQQFKIINIIANYKNLDDQEQQRRSTVIAFKKFLSLLLDIPELKATATTKSFFKAFQITKKEEGAKAALVRVAKHLFLKSPEERMKTFSDLHKLIKSTKKNTVFSKRLQQIYGSQNMGALREYFKWKENIANWCDALKSVYWYDNPDGNLYRDGIYDLIKFLRNLYHRRAIYVAVEVLDQDVKKQWPGLVEKLMELIEI